jgi:prophage antirepressor-like protein
LFKAKDIGDLLGIKDVLSTVKYFDNDEKGVGYYPTPGGIQQMVMLKEQGLYKILMIVKTSP